MPSKVPTKTIRLPIELHAPLAAYAKKGRMSEHAAIVEIIRNTLTASEAPRPEPVKTIERKPQPRRSSWNLKKAGVQIGPTHHAPGALQKGVNTPKRGGK